MTLEDGEAVYRQIHDPLVHGETVELDFDGVNIFASPFFNAGIGRLRRSSNMLSSELP